MFTIHLNKLVFFANHGLYEEEKKTGAEFEVDVAIHFNPAARVTSIHHTINYANAYAVIKKQMEEPVPLLETLVENITDAIHLMDERISAIDISVKKLNPPIINFTGNVAVSFSKVF